MNDRRFQSPIRFFQRLPRNESDLPWPFSNYSAKGAIALDIKGIDHEKRPLHLDAAMVGYGNERQAVHEKLGQLSLGMFGFTLSFDEIARAANTLPRIRIDGRTSNRRSRVVVITSGLGREEIERSLHAFNAIAAPASTPTTAHGRGRSRPGAWNDPPRSRRTALMGRTPLPIVGPSPWRCHHDDCHGVIGFL